MHILANKMVVRICAAATLAFAMGAGTANAATFNIFNISTSNLLGTFEAPAAGGAVTSMSVSVAGHVFDMLGTGSLAPIYHSASNDLSGTPGGIGGTTNSAASGVCGIGECVFTFERSVLPTPGEWHVEKILPLSEQANITGGFYEIKMSAVPLPASIPLLVGALGLMAFVGRKRKSR